MIRDDERINHYVIEARVTALRKWALDWCLMQIHEDIPNHRPCMKCIKDSATAFFEMELEDEG